MADAADHRQRGAGDGAGDHFFVERPQVLDAAAAAADDQQLDLLAQVGRIDGGGDLCRGAVALYRRRVQDQRDAGHAPAQGGDHVAQRGGGRRGDDADGGGVAGQRFFVAIVEQSFRRQFRLQLFEGLVQAAEAGRTHHVDVDLVVAARLVQRHRAAQFDLHAFL
ncbi:hypothetical protein D3C72_1952110 [compost metagenome]